MAVAALHPDFVSALQGRDPRNPMAHAGEWAEEKVELQRRADDARGLDASDLADPPDEAGAQPPSGRSRARLASSELARLIVRGGAWSLGISATGAALSLVVHLALARTLGAEEYGRYVFALAWMNVLAPVGKFELDT